jgi:hypothetical protein
LERGFDLYPPLYSDNNTGVGDPIGGLGGANPVIAGSASAASMRLPFCVKGAGSQLTAV